MTIDKFMLTAMQKIFLLNNVILALPAKATII